jgi:Fe-S oxidoreductase
MLFEEFLAREHRAGNLHLALKPIAHKKALLHVHCHQKAFGLMPDVETVLKLIPELDVETIESGCCGMAGAFGYMAENYAVSRKIGELALLPAIRKSETDALVIANGTSCRNQITMASQHQGLHLIQVLERALH